MKIFVLAEKEKAIKELCAGARSHADQVELVALTQAQALAGVADRIWAVPVPQGSMMEDATDTIADLIEAEKPDILFVEPTRRMKLITGRLAARMKTSVVTDVLSIEDGTVSAMYFGGIAHRHVKSAGSLLILSIGPGAFGDLEPSGTDGVVTVGYIAPKSSIVRRSVVPIEKSGVDLTVAKRVVGAGRGIVAEEDLGMIREFAREIGAELGCTRPLCEAEHWFPRELYIGVSGLMLSPDVYVAIGISGQTQHTVGIDRAKTVIAVNKDKNAPIFNHADYGLVADLYKAVPKLIEQFK